MCRGGVQVGARGKRLFPRARRKSHKPRRLGYCRKTLIRKVGELLYASALGLVEAPIESSVGVASFTAFRLLTQILCGITIWPTQSRPNVTAKSKPVTGMFAPAPRGCLLRLLSPCRTKSQACIVPLIAIVEMPLESREHHI